MDGIGKISSSIENKPEDSLETSWSDEEEEPQPQLTKADLIAKRSNEEGRESEPEADFITNWPSEEYFDMLKEEEGPKRPKVDHSERWSSDEESHAKDEELTQLWMEFEYNRELLMREAEEEEAKRNRGEISKPKTCCWDDEAIQDEILGSICQHCGKSM